jgi:hypothetical protein
MYQHQSTLTDGPDFLYPFHESLGSHLRSEELSPHTFIPSLISGCPNFILLFYFSFLV